MKAHRTIVIVVGTAVAVAAAVLVLRSGGDPVRSDYPYPTLPPEKQAIADREEKLRLDALAAPIPPAFAKGPPPTRQPPSSPLPDNILRIPAGAGTIVEEGLAPFPSSAYLFQNSWHEAQGDQTIIVYAGVEAHDRSQGLAVVLVDLDYKPVPGAGGFYLTPSKSGSVRIVDAQGLLLPLDAKDGTRFLFDVASRQFLSPDTLLPIPTVPPPPAPTPRPTPPPIATVAIDADSGHGGPNTATSLGPRDGCATLSKGGSLIVDVTVDAISPVAGKNGGITAFQFVLHYDPAVVKVVAAGYGMLLGANPAFNPISMSDATPDSDGRFVVGVADFGDRSSPASGAGVLARITLQGVGPGFSNLTLSDVIIADASSSSYTIENILPAQVAVDTACPLIP